MGEKNGYSALLEGNSSLNTLVAFYWKLPIGRKDTSFRVKYQKLLVRTHQLNYKEVFRGNTYLNKVCCDLYSPLYYYD